MRRLMPLFAVTLLLVSAVVADEKDKPNTPPAGFEALFNGKDLTGWEVLNGKKEAWDAGDGLLFVKGGGGGWLMTKKEYGDFELRVEFKLPKAGNSGVALRAPMMGDPAYAGMEIQLLDDSWYKDPKNYKGIKQTQLTGSIYGVVPPSEDATKPAGEWNTIRIVAKGPKVTIELNGKKTIDADLEKHKDEAKAHPGLLRDKGHLGLQSHDGRVEFRNVYVKSL